VVNQVMRNTSPLTLLTLSLYCTPIMRKKVHRGGYMCVRGYNRRELSELSVVSVEKPERLGNIQGPGGYDRGETTTTGGGAKP